MKVQLTVDLEAAVDYEVADFGRIDDRMENGYEEGCTRGVFGFRGGLGSPLPCGIALTTLSASIRRVRAPKLPFSNVPFAIVSSNSLDIPAGAASLSPDRFPSKHVLPFDWIDRSGHDEYSTRDSNLEVNPP